MAWLAGLPPRNVQVAIITAHIWTVNYKLRGGKMMHRAVSIRQITHALCAADRYQFRTHQQAERHSPAELQFIYCYTPKYKFWYIHKL